jgi:hypothetical protein
MRFRALPEPLHRFVTETAMMPGNLLGRAGTSITALQRNPDLQEELAAKRIDLPVVLVTGHRDIPMSVRAMKSGAVEFEEADRLASYQRPCSEVSGWSNSIVDKPSTLVSFFQKIFCMPLPSIEVEQDRFSEN